MKSVLVVKTSSIGDVIQTFPVLAYLRAKFPEAKIDWVVERSCADLVRAHPQVDQVLEVDTRAWRKNLLSKKSRFEIAKFLRLLRAHKYDLLIDLQGNTKSAIITLLAKAQEKVGFSWKSLPEKLNWFATTHHYPARANACARRRYLGLVQNHLGDLDDFVTEPALLHISSKESSRLNEILSATHLEGRSKLMICFGSRWKNKQLKEDTFVELLSRIEDAYKPAFLFIWGNQEEKQIAEAFAAFFPNSSLCVGELSLNLWQMLMTKMQGILAVDSAALHLAGTTSTPSFSIFGPSLASFYKPEGEQHVAYQGFCPYKRVFVRRCPVLRTCPTGACIRNIEVDDLFQSFSSWWKANDRSRRALPQVESLL